MVLRCVDSNRSIFIHFQRTVELCFLIRGVLYLPVFLACELVVHTHMHIHNTFA